MDDLELLKQDWQREKPNEFPHYSEKELFQMSKKNSVSIAKWVFVIGVLEMVFWCGIDYLLTLFFGEDEDVKTNTIIDGIYDVVSTILSLYPYLFLGVLAYLFYKIKNTESSNRLMKKIKWMKQAIHWYIKLLLIYVISEFSFGFLSGILSESSCEKEKDLSLMAEWIINIFAFTMLLIVCFGIIIVLKHIYYFIYGRFIKQLEENYQELSKIETQETSE